MKINGSSIGGQHPMYIIAELSANHGQSLEVAKELVRAAAKAGADAVKLQTYTPDTMTLDVDNKWFRIGPGTAWEGRKLYDLYGEAYTPWEWHGELVDEARRAGIHCFSTPFDRTAVDFLDELDVPAFKIASFECTDTDLIAYAASKGRPMIMSTGMATAEEIDAAVRVAQDAGNVEIALLRCNSSYPSPPDEMDLRTIQDMHERWNCPIGLSDHTIGHEAAVAARALGAVLLEKHIMLDETKEGPDSGFSAGATAFRTMVEAVRRTERLLGTVRYGPSAHEQPSLIFRRSIFSVQNIAKGERFSNENVRVIRPSHGLPPNELSRLIGCRAARNIKRGHPIGWDMVEDNP